jgi:hypothetical protein
MLTVATGASFWVMRAICWKSTWSLKPVIAWLGLKARLPTIPAPLPRGKNRKTAIAMTIDTLLTNSVSRRIDRGRNRWSCLSVMALASSGVMPMTALAWSVSVLRWNSRQQ